MKISKEEGPSGLNRSLSPLSVWALAFGCAVGWGAFVMPGTTFLPIAGPIGTALGMVVGGLIMLLIGYNYHYLINRYPDVGGTFAYTKNIFGYDHGFMSSWFLMLVYIAIIWANATAIPLLCRNLLGSTFQFGFHYEIAGYTVWLGEAILTLAAIWLFGFISARSNRAASLVQTVAAVALLGGIVIGFFAAVVTDGFDLFAIQPAYAPGKTPLGAILGIAVLSPWAFAGFESISHAAEEVRFSVKKSFLIMAAAVCAGILAYSFLGVFAVSAIPEGYASWVEYINDLGNLPGMEGLPTFHAAHAIMGKPGLFLLALTVSAGIITGLVGNFYAVSRLLYALTRDDLLPGWFGRLGRSGEPKNAIFAIMLLSTPIPFLGRAAIGWIVDVNTIGATIAYAYTSAAAFKAGRTDKNALVKCTGLIGALISFIFFVYFMVPNRWTVSALSTESYMIFIAWGMLGFLFFRYIFNRDTKRRFGKSTVVWIMLLFLILFTSLLWLREATTDTTSTVLSNLNRYYEDELTENGVELNEIQKADSEYYLSRQVEEVDRSLTSHSVVQMVLIVISLFIMLQIYNSMMEREKTMEVQKVEAEQSNRAKSTFLSTMSHDIRTPMNAIIGYTNLLKKDTDIGEGSRAYLDKIEASSQHLLALINDVLEMSRIESGKMELDAAKSNIVKALDDVRDLFATQMEEKGLTYTVDTSGVTHRMVMCDTNRLNRVLLNLISNAYKFTPKGGSVTVTLKETGATAEKASYELSVRDTGIGMTPEFAAKVFEAYERDRTVNNIQGTGLGTAITKSIVDMMGGTIDVDTELGKGTQFTVHLDLPLAEEEPEDREDQRDIMSRDIDFGSMRLLLVEDNEINRELASLILTEVGFQLDTAENGEIAFHKVRDSEPGYFDAVLMDVQMPVMNGYQATAAIRGLPDEALAHIPIIAMTANAFAEDVQAAKDAGMDGHIAKPIDVNAMLETLIGILDQRD